MKPVDFLLPRHEGHLVTVTNIGRSRDVAFTGVTCSVIVTWTDDDKDSETVYRTCGQVTLCPQDIVIHQFGLLFNTSSVLSGLYVNISCRECHPHTVNLLALVFFCSTEELGHSFHIPF